ncbi:hypothetical protein, partial [Escherichia coli]|uniref:hypothetical protein n=2 Tax=Escherichia coli TaxID=562 RepID=UPI003B5A2FEA
GNPCPDLGSGDTKTCRDDPVTIISSDSRLQGAFQKGILALTYQGLFHFIVQQNGCSTPDYKSK